MGIFTNESGINLLAYLKGEILDVLVAVLVKMLVPPSVLCGPRPIDTLLSTGSIGWLFGLFLIKSELSSVEWWLLISWKSRLIGDYLRDYYLLPPLKIVDIGVAS
jgi:hypothetical protein